MVGGYFSAGSWLVERSRSCFSDSVLPIRLRRFSMILKQTLKRRGRYLVDLLDSRVPLLFPWRHQRPLERSAGRKAGSCFWHHPDCLRFVYGILCRKPWAGLFDLRCRRWGWNWLFLRTVGGCIARLICTSTRACDGVGGCGYRRGHFGCTTFLPLTGGEFGLA